MAARGSILPIGSAGFALYTLVLMAAATLLPPVAFDSNAKQFILIIGALAIWRYSWGLLHYARYFIYTKRVFPRWRRQTHERLEELMPSAVYLLITSFRIDVETSIKVFHATVREAINCGAPTTIVASIVEKGDETLVKEIFNAYDTPDHVRLEIVRIPGTGKRDGLAHGFLAIQRDNPPEDAVVAVIDGDTVMKRGTITRTATFFKLLPNIGGLTTDEDCQVKGSQIMKDWHRFRFAQRHISMGSWALSRKLSTLTGRMSVFRASIICDPEFIKEVADDHIDHWRFGRLKFLTGDDKSSCFHLMKKGWDMIYVPDVLVETVEHPPAENFFKASTMLMFRWSGNMLRTNGRLLSLGPKRIGFFIWWCVLDQRITMWTCLSGPVFVVMLALKYSLSFIPVYFVWIGFTRWVMSLMLLASRPVLNWRYPFLIYYTQIYGALVKTWVLFRLNRQSWTRQKTKLQGGTAAQERWVDFSSALLHSVAFLCFVCVIGLISGVFELAPL